MAFDFAAGLSAAGAALSKTAGEAAIESQKAELQRQAVILADQLAGARQDKQNVFTTSEREATQTYQSGEKEKDRKTSLDVANIGLEGHKVSAGAAIRSAEISAAAHKYTADVGATPPDVRTAQWYAKASPEEREAYRTNLSIKAGLPPFMTAPSGSGGTGTGGDAGVTPEGNKAEPAKGGSKESGIDESLFKDVPPEAHATVKAMIDGRLPVPSSFAMAKPYWQNMVQYAQKVDPNFDASTWASRNATRKDFASGQSAKAVTALNTALGHAGLLTENFDKLDNGSLPMWNAFINEIGTQFGSSKVTNAKMAVDALASEARKVFAASGGGNLTELQEWQKSFPINGSPEQQKGAMKQFVGLLDSRLEALANQYNRGMGRTQDPLQLLDPHARQVYEKLTGQRPLNATGYQGGKPPTLTREEYERAPSGTTFTDPNGVVRVKP